MTKKFIIYIKYELYYFSYIFLCRICIVLNNCIFKILIESCKPYYFHIDIPHVDVRYT